MVNIPLTSPTIDTLATFEETSKQLQCPSFANNDIYIVIEFLKQYDANQATFEAYHCEI